MDEIRSRDTLYTSVRRYIYITPWRHCQGDQAKGKPPDYIRSLRKQSDIYDTSEVMFATRPTAKVSAADTNCF
jgi:hypothetical protein